MRKNVVGYEGIYTVDEEGNVISTKRNRPICKTIFPSGYVYVHLHKARQGKQVRLHRVVAEAFIPNPDNLPEVNHKDGDKTNNHVSNLEWCDSLSNTRHAIKLGLIKCIGELNPSAKLTQREVNAIRMEYVRRSKIHGTVELARKYNVSNVMIGNIIRNKNWTDGDL